MLNDEVPQQCSVRAFPDNSGGELPSARSKFSHRLNKNIYPFEMAQFSDRHKIARTGGGRDRHEFRGADAVVHNAYERARRADGGLVGVLGKGALEQQQVGAAHQDTLGGPT